MKTKARRAVIKPAYQRLQEWRARICPYCGCGNVMTGIIDDGRYRAICFNPECQAENLFSGPILRKGGKEV